MFFRYKTVIDTCSLQLDIDLLPFGDQTEIGERVCTCLFHRYIYMIIYSYSTVTESKCTIGIFHSLTTLKRRDICGFSMILLFFYPDIFLFLIMCFCGSGHQPERRSETENLCGPSSLPEHQHCLLGELNFRRNTHIFFCYIWLSQQWNEGILNDFYRT